jgi:hypothetical protein
MPVQLRLCSCINPVPTLSRWDFLFKPIKFLYEKMVVCFFLSLAILIANTCKKKIFFKTQKIQRIRFVDFSFVDFSCNTTSRL